MASSWVLNKVEAIFDGKICITESIHPKTMDGFVASKN
jgi:hypothetical protein